MIKKLADDTRGKLQWLKSILTIVSMVGYRL